jgi:anti-sigma factor RsiW
VNHLGHRLSALIDGELGDTQRERVLAHLARCEPCRREAAALRALKRRMHALGEATVDAALTDRLVAMGARYPVPGAALARRRWPVRSLAVAALALAGLGIPAAAFMAGGGGQAEPGPGVTPAIDMFMVQHEFSTGDVPASTASPSPSSTPRQRGLRQHGLRPHALLQHGHRQHWAVEPARAR